MLGLFARGKRNAGWMAISVGEQALEYAHARVEPGAKPPVGVFGSQPLDSDKHSLQKLAQGIHLGRYNCAALLRLDDYQLLLLDAPGVPRDEWKNAARWKIKDMIDYRVDDATIDVLDIPPPEGAGARQHSMYAVAAKNEVIEATIRRYEEARIPLAVIDILETAQRNLAALYETGGTALGFAYFADEWGLLTINFHGELYLARRFEVGLRQMAAGGGNETALERVGVEIQRTLDHFDRQFRSIPMGALLLAPAPRDPGVGAFLKARLGLEARQVDLREVLAFPGGDPDAETQWRLFHHFGAALRSNGTRAS